MIYIYIYTKGRFTDADYLNSPHKAEVDGFLSMQFPPLQAPHDDLVVSSKVVFKIIIFLLKRLQKL